jgi:hypothetical protein
MSDSEWLEGSFRLRVRGSQRFLWQKGWVRGAFGIHSYLTENEARLVDEGPEEVDVFVLTHLPTGYRMGGAFSLEHAMEICAIVDETEDWVQLSSKKQAADQRWQVARDKIGAGLTAAGFGHAFDHSESRVFVKLGPVWPPEQQVAQ